MGFIHDMFEIGKVLIEALNGQFMGFSLGTLKDGRSEAPGSGL